MELTQKENEALLRLCTRECESLRAQMQVLQFGLAAQQTREALNTLSGAASKLAAAMAGVRVNLKEGGLSCGR